MNVLIKACRIVDPQSAFFNQQKDVLIENGVISQIADSIDVSASTEIIKGEDLRLSPGWIDMCVDFCDPGFEHKEDVISGLDAAAKGGFTAVGILPNTQPVIDNKSQVQYLLNKAKGSLTDILVIGAATAGLDNSHLAEMYDMETAGAIAFSNGKKAISNAGTMMRCLQYVLPNKGLIINFPDDAALSANGHLNEGQTSTKMGLKGRPNLAEFSIVQRDINLVEYTNSRLHFSQISTQQSVNLIKDAKAKGLAVSCAVSPWHLIFTDAVLADFDSAWKINPPLRIEADKQALITALKDGTIDCISSFHNPQDVDCKDVEFNHADFGAIGLQTTFLLLNHYLEDEIDDALLVNILAINARKILNIKAPEIAEGKPANLTIYSRKGETTINAEMIASKSKNTPLLGQSLKGRVIATYNNGQLIKNPA